MSPETSGQRSSSALGKRSIVVEDELHTTDDPSDIPYQSVPSGQVLPPANFRAFYTLVEDTLSAEHHHPAVHYIFDDDDPDIVTHAILETLHSELPDPNHRLVLVDMQTDGRTVKSAQSLSQAWQISNVSVAPAPAWTEAGPETMPEGLMLKIEGAEAEVRKSKSKGPQKSGEEAGDAVQRIEADLEKFKARLEHLQHIVAKDPIL